MNECVSAVRPLLPVIMLGSFLAAPAVMAEDPPKGDAAVTVEEPHPVVPVWCRAPLPIIMDDTPPYTVHVVTKKDVAAAKGADRDVLRHLFGGRAPLVSRFNRIDPKRVRFGHCILVPDIPEGRTFDPLPARWPGETAHEKSILIVLDRQFLGTYEGGVLVASYPINSGALRCQDAEGQEKSCKTPEGHFTISRKDKDHESDTYPEPDGGAPMPWGLRFHNGYWIHGGDMVGFPASHGCVRMFDQDAEKLFGWADIGIRVRIMNTLPRHY